MKLKTLEQFEQKDPCECGGNCGCGDNSVNEAKKYKFKDLAKAWQHVYGEDMEDEYQGFFQEVIGKHKNKVTKQDIADIWMSVYGEDIAVEYDGFYNELKENLEQVAKLEELDNLVEANTDGTISDDEDERMDIAEEEFYDKALTLAQELKEEAYEIGGNFRGPGYEHKLMLQVKDAFKKAKLKLR